MRRLPNGWRVYSQRRSPPVIGFLGRSASTRRNVKVGGIVPYAIVGVLIGLGTVSFVDLVGGKSLPFSPSLWFCEDQSHRGLVGTAAVIDGDTIRLCGVDASIRLYGIDAPEGSQRCSDAEGRSYRCGANATAALRDLIGRTATVSCERKDVDRYGRIVAICRTGGLDLNAEMVRQGWALEYRRYSDGRYRDEEAAAREEQRGMWAGRFVAPWDHRRGETIAYR